MHGPPAAALALVRPGRWPRTRPGRRRCPHRCWPRWRAARASRRDGRLGARTRRRRPRRRAQLGGSGAGAGCDQPPGRRAPLPAAAALARSTVAPASSAWPTNGTGGPGQGGHGLGAGPSRRAASTGRPDRRPGRAAAGGAAAGRGGAGRARRRRRLGAAGPAGGRPGNNLVGPATPDSPRRSGRSLHRVDQVRRDARSQRAADDGRSL